MSAESRNRTWLPGEEGRPAGRGSSQAEGRQRGQRRAERGADVTGAGPRQWLIAASLVVGAMLGFLLLSHVGHWLAQAPGAGQ